jgi:hypothetical protein
MSRLGLARRDLPARMLIGNEISLFPSALARIPRKKSSDERVHLLSKLREMCKEFTEELSGAKSWKKFRNLRLDTPRQCVSFLIPPKAGLRKLGVCSTYIWDCKLEAQFCPRLRQGYGGQAVS